uniref:Uncharacterized protein n=1 Tax=Periophthalmus magnuspinnatus TaxID=409849 RepID=A0A3B4BF55_9GOBI
PQTSSLHEYKYKIHMYYVIYNYFLFCLRSQQADINCTDLLGNTPLHCAAYRGQRQCALKLLKSGASPSINNKQGMTHTLL